MKKFVLFLLLTMWSCSQQQFPNSSRYQYKDDSKSAGISAIKLSQKFINPGGEITAEGHIYVIGEIEVNSVIKITKKGSVAPYKNYEEYADNQKESFVQTLKAKIDDEGHYTVHVEAFGSDGSEFTLTEDFTVIQVGSPSIDCSIINSDKLKGGRKAYVDGTRSLAAYGDDQASFSEIKFKLVDEKGEEELTADWEGWPEQEEFLSGVFSFVLPQEAGKFKLLIEATNSLNKKGSYESELLTVEAGTPYPPTYDNQIFDLEDFKDNTATFDSATLKTLVLKFNILSEFETETALFTYDNLTVKNQKDSVKVTFNGNSTHNMTKKLAIGVPYHLVINFNSSADFYALSEKTGDKDPSSTTYTAPTATSATIGSDKSISIIEVVGYKANATEDFCKEEAFYALPKDSEGTGLVKPIVSKESFKMFSKFDAVASEAYRIPTIMTLQDTNGKLTNDVIAVADARFMGSGDAPGNIDTVARISRDGGKSWGTPFLIPALHFQDKPDTKPTQQFSACSTDPSLVQNYKTGRIILRAVVFPWDGGINTTGVGSGFIDKTVDGETKKVLALKMIEDMPETGTRANSVESGWPETFNYWVKKSDEFPAEVGGKMVRRIYTNSNVPTKYFLNENYEVWEQSEGLVADYLDGDNQQEIETVYNKSKALMVKQYITGKQVPMNILYKFSIFQMFRTTYTYVCYSDDKGVTWSAPININGQIKKPENKVKYLIPSPGRGLFVTELNPEANVNLDPENGRIFFMNYTNEHPTLALEGEFAMISWSDDNGKTWTMGQAPSSHGDCVKTSEANIVQMPDKSIRVFARTGVLKVGTMRSTDGGKTLSEPKKIEALNSGASNGNLLSVVNYSTNPLGGNGTLIISHSNRRESRNDGCIRFGVINDESGEDIDWSKGVQVTEGQYSYSGLTELPTRDDKVKIGVLYEDSNRDYLPYLSLTEEQVKQNLN